LGTARVAADHPCWLSRHSGADNKKEVERGENSWISDSEIGYTDDIPHPLDTRSAVSYSPSDLKAALSLAQYAGVFRTAHGEKQWALGLADDGWPSRRQSVAGLQLADRRPLRAPVSMSLVALKVFCQRK